MKKIRFYTTPEGEKLILIQKATDEERAERIASIKQKLIGISMLLIGIILPIITQEATFSLIAIPCGLFTIFTKEKIML